MIVASSVKKSAALRLAAVSALVLACAAALPAGASAAATLVTLWGSQGSGPGQFSNPDDLAVGPFGDIYVADTDNHRIQQFNSDGVFIREFGSFGTGAGQLSSPHGIDVDATGKVYVADTGNHRVVRFGETGAFERAWGKGVATGPASNNFELCTSSCFAGVSDTTPGAFSSPQGLTVDAFENVYVSEFFGNQRVQVFRPDGTLTGVSWGSVGTGNGQFNRPIALAASNVGEIYVADRDNARIQRFDSAGTFLNTWGSSGAASGQFLGSLSVAVDPSGNVWVGDRTNLRMQQFSPDGIFIDSFDSFDVPFPGPTGNNTFAPAGVDVDPQSGDLYVIDGQANFSRVLRLRPAPTPVQGETVSASVVSGKVLVDVPGDGKGFVPLDEGTPIPVGTKVDTRQGRVAITSATSDGGTQTADFFDARFQIRQRTGKDLTTMKILERPQCGGGRGSRDELASRKRRPGLWGSGNGHFASQGSHGSASVRGTEWLLFEACGGITGTTVKQGKVRFRNFYTRRTTIVNAGETAIARPVKGQ